MPSCRPEEQYRETVDRAERRRIQAAVIEANRQHVVWFVRKSVAARLREEAEQVGCIGLLVALEKYDPSCTTYDHEEAFWRFASPYVRDEIQRWMDVAVYWRKSPNRGKSETRRAAAKNAKLHRQAEYLDDACALVDRVPTVEELFADAEAKALLEAFLRTLSDDDRHLLTCERRERRNGGVAAGNNDRARHYLSLVERAIAFVRGPDNDHGVRE